MNQQLEVIWQEINIPGFVMDTRVEEFVIDGGNPMPAGSFSFRMDDYGNIKMLKNGKKRL